MSLFELLPKVQLLSPKDKLHLIELLARELAEEKSPPLIPPGESFSVWSPESAFAAAQTMLRVLAAEGSTPMASR